MVFGTPHEGYDSTRASALLHEVGEQPISIAKTNLLSRGILSKLVKDPSRPRPGRAFKISEMYALLHSFSMYVLTCSTETKTQSEVPSVKIPFKTELLLRRFLKRMRMTGGNGPCFPATVTSLLWFKLRQRIRRVFPLSSFEYQTYTLLQVDFKIDTSQPQFHRQTLEWNSKKAGE